jgi:hypothetical protein
MFPIATWTASGSATTFTFTNIPQTFTHLQLRSNSRASNAIADDQVGIYFNSDTNLANYSLHQFWGTGAAVQTYGSGSGVAAFVLFAAGGTTLANAWGVGILDVLDYTNTNKKKTMRSITGLDRNGGGRILTTSSLWNSTTAITSITLFNQSTGAFVDGSRFDLYGIASSNATGA